MSSHVFYIAAFETVRSDLPNFGVACTGRDTGMHPPDPDSTPGSSIASLGLWTYGAKIPPKPIRRKAGLHVREHAKEEGK